jgi:hypothetical protein
MFLRQICAPAPATNADGIVAVRASCQLENGNRFVPPLNSTVSPVRSVAYSRASTLSSRFQFTNHRQEVFDSRA